ncbi:fatty acid desaturase [Adhaeribacter radiodurans]|uniref:Fatty acid desaturase n=1 Tax=Adhaeribacter radiodurans TaxID=2745197 RepID=A0A7L7L5T1_9BACT|nr:fatty acid desaturase [Adhaeribacter radiodurans]QMU28168.1 fatty acid desaturase [Adhaeribacter radiodurans]
MNLYKIPVKTNIILTAVCTVSYFSLLWKASHATHLGWVIMYGIMFAFIMVPVYSLIHEAEHNILHPNEKMNAFMGRWLCTLFIVPYSFFKHCHLKHHKKNRTDEEMWDLYYEHQEKWRRYGNLYAMMIGLGYFALWLAVILFAFAPRLLFTKFFRSHKEIAGFIKGSEQEQKVKRSMVESWLILLFCTACFYLLQLKWSCWLVLFGMHGFLWSSQNYVNHAFSPRDIINGAHNLHVPFWANWLYLNFNLHLAHHQNPQVSWIHLPLLVKAGSQRITFLKNYIRLWKGPRLTKEPEPKN